MVMCLILKVDQPLFFHSIYLDRHHNAACIDLIRLLLILKFPLSLKPAHCHERKIHQADELILPARKDLAVVF